MNAVDACAPGLPPHLTRLLPPGSLLMLGACAPVPHFTETNPSIEGQVVNGTTEQGTANTRIALTTAIEEPRTYETRSEAAGRFFFEGHRQLQLYAVLADARPCALKVTVHAQGHRTCQHSWIAPPGCPTAPVKLRLSLKPSEQASPAKALGLNEDRIESATGMGL